MFQNAVIAFLAFALSALCGFVSIPQVLNFCKRNNLYDIPNARKIHRNAVPRLGGICFLPSMLVSFSLALIVMAWVTNRSQIDIGVWSLMFLISLFVVYSVGIIDDIVGLNAKTKFVAQILAACLLPMAGLYINNFYGFLGIHAIPFWVGAPLTVFVIVFICNAMNLIDGIDGLSGGLSLLSLGGFLFCFAREGVWIYCTLIAGLMGVLVPYLYHNIWGDASRNRKIFMGDSGSLTLGFILGFLVIKFAMDNPSVMPYRRDSLLLSYTLMIVPTFDVARVILVRLRHRKPIFDADKNHIHHKLMRAGLSQHVALLVILALSFFFMALNHCLYAVSLSADVVVLVDVLAYVAFHLTLDNIICKRGRDVTE